jgi:hypothetical protein
MPNTLLPYDFLFRDNYTKGSHRNRIAALCADRRFVNLSDTVIPTNYKYGTHVTAFVSAEKV